MIEIKTFIHNPFHENTYLLWDETKAAVLIDPGAYSDVEKNEVVQFIMDNHLQPEKMICTHGHVDHILGSSYFGDLFSLSLEYHPEEKHLIDHAADFAASYGFDFNQMPFLAPILMDRGTIRFGKSSLDVIHVPGHSAGSVAFYSEKDKILISGDVLFKQTIGRTDLPGGDYDVLMHSITQKLLSLPADTKVYPGHGPSTSIAEEMEQNDFISDFLNKA